MGQDRQEPPHQPWQQLAPLSPPQQWRRVKLIFGCHEDGAWDQRPSTPHVLRVGDKLRMYYTDKGARSADPHRITGDIYRIALAEADVGDPFAWRKCLDGPLLDVGPAGTIDSRWAGYPCVVPITDDHWHMYYVAWGGEYDREVPTRKVCHISMAESDDGGITWSRTGRSLIRIGRPGACDEHTAGSCFVCRYGDEYWMWYTAISRPREEWFKGTVALAVSDDGGHTFSQHPAGAVVEAPAMIGTLGSKCAKPFVEASDRGVLMWFSYAADCHHYRVHYAESWDGIHFSWLPEPVLDAGPPGWDDSVTCYPSILRLEGRALMFYCGNDYVGIGVAECTTL